MAAFTAKDVQALREKTGVGMMECKKALVEAEGDMDKAVEILKERGLATQQKKSSRVAAEGVVVAYNDKENKVGVLVEVNCETDFVAKNPDFVALANKIAKTVAEKNPADVDALLATTLTGADCTVEAAVQELFLAIRENMKVRRFARVEGVVETYIHAGGAVGVMVQFETDDATAAKDEFVAMGKNVAMQVAAMSPEYLSESDITPDELAKMKNITVESALNKPESLPKPLLKKVFEKVLSE
ncbi:MAG: translation elongation factor Ts, partial [Clostridia bacterium]|nr:translation elongation factor Ts [Clostridia bacterium]